MLIAVGVIAVLFGLLIGLRPVNAGTGTMSQRWLEQQRASRPE